jgi:DNA invertase Pin-like site-specific DNA recombinase
MANLMLSVKGALAEFKRALIRGRNREGIELAKPRRRLLIPALRTGLLAASTRVDASF